MGIGAARVDAGLLVNCLNGLNSTAAFKIKTKFD
jgi:hypothetical protein